MGRRPRAVRPAPARRVEHLSRALTGGALVWVVVVDALLLACWPMWAAQIIGQLLTPRGDLGALQRAEGLEQVAAAGALAGVLGLVLTGAMPRGRSWLRRGAVLTALLYLALLVVQGAAAFLTPSR